MSTGTTLTRPSLRLRMMTVSSISGIQRLIHLHRNLRNPTFTKLMNCCAQQNKHRSRISRNIQYSAVSSSQKKRWICQFPLVRLNEFCCCVYITFCVLASASSVCYVCLLFVLTNAHTRTHTHTHIYIYIFIYIYIGCQKKYTHFNKGKNYVKIVILNLYG